MTLFTIVERGHTKDTANEKKKHQMLHVNAILYLLNELDEYASSLRRCSRSLHLIVYLIISLAFVAAN